MKKILPQKDSVHSPSLVKLGLTPDETKCYSILLAEGALEARQLSKFAGIFPNAVYRLIDNLQEKGFVVKLDTSPVKFQAIPAQVAIPAYTRKKIKEVEELQTESINSFTTTPSTGSAGIEIITGRQAMFIRGAEMIQSARKEVLIISIGEPVPDEIKLANRDAIARSVSVKFIAQVFNEDNQSLLDSWKRMGMEVRHFPGMGYHLTIIDGKQCLLAASNPQNPAERVSMLINSEGLSQAMRNYFYSVWDKALPI